MIVHHLFTLFFVLLSWVVNNHRQASIILLFHDITDVFIEGGKCLKYAKQDKAASVVFVLFCASWVLMRLIVLPRFIYCFIVKVPFPFFPAYTIAIGTSLVGLMLQLVWTAQIISFVVRSVKTGALQDDDRSDSNDTDKSD